MRPIELPSCIVSVPSAVPHCVSSPPMPSPSSNMQSLQGCDGLVTRRTGAETADTSGRTPQQFEQSDGITGVAPH